MSFSIEHSRLHRSLLPAGLLSVFLSMGTAELTGCLLSPVAAEAMESEMGVVNLFVGPEQVDCVGVAPQKCYQVSYSPKDDYQFFYSAIRGFDYEPGYNYEIRVLKTPVPNPPADASSINWTIVEVISKIPATSSPSREEVCDVVTKMPSADDTDEMLALLRHDREEVIIDLEAMSSNMQQYDAEGYGWQNVIDGSGALEPRPSSWLIGALRMACEN